MFVESPFWMSNGELVQKKQHAKNTTILFLLN